MNKKNYSHMSKDHNPYDPELEKAHFEVFDLLRRDEGVSVSEIITTSNFFYSIPHNISRMDYFP